MGEIGEVYKKLKEEYKIPKEYLVALRVYELTERKNPPEKVWYSKLAEFFEKEEIYTRKSVHDALANLLRWGVLTGSLEEINMNRKKIVRVLYVSGEWGEFLGQLYEVYFQLKQQTQERYPPNEQ